MQKKRRRLTLVGLSTLLLAGSVLGVFFPNQGDLEAAVQKKKITYTAESGVKTLTNLNTVIFGKVKTASTINISENAGTNNKIQKIVFYRGTEEVKTVNVNAQSYTGSETFTGKPVPVLSKENGSAGSWFAWSRGITDPLWQAGNNGKWYAYDDTDGEIKTEDITTVNSGRTYRFDYREYPYKKVRLTIKYPRTKNYFGEINGKDVQIPTSYIDDTSDTIRQQNPNTPNGTNVMVDNSAAVDTGDLPIKGTNDSSTEIESIKIGVEPDGNENAPTRSLDYATIQFTQKHGPTRNKYYLRESDTSPMVNYGSKGPNAQAMIFYYAAYKFQMKSFTYQYPDSYWVYTEKGEPETGGSIGFCNVREGRTIEGDAEGMKPNPNAAIKADQRDREVFDVLQGIPTSESLYGNVLTKNYLNQYKFQEHKVTCIYEVDVTQLYVLKWDPGQPNPATPPVPARIPNPQQEDAQVIYPIHTERYFTYWTVEKLGIYQIDSAELKNYAFEGESITIYPEGYTPPTLVLQKDGSYTAPEKPAAFVAPGVIERNGGTSKPSPSNDVDLAQGYVEEKIGQVKGKNDKVVFNGQTIMSDQEAEVQTQVPSRIPNGTMSSRDVLYSQDHMIPKTKTNRMAAPSMGTVTYVGLDDNYDADDGDTYPIPGINPVTVHTPVVNYSSTSDDAAHNQKTTPNYSRQAFILDRPFTITMPTSGQHQNYPGYGNRDYAKYYRSKEVYFPFDTYSSDRSIFYPKGTWINIPVGQIVTEFFLPVWVDEGDYTVTFRNTAENAPGIQPTQQDANFDLINHVASDTVDVEVIGRLYDFHITDIADYNWEMVFRAQEGSAVHTGNTYWTGLNGIDGATRGNTSPFTLPILPGSNPLEGMKNITVKTGYHIKFDLKTKGNMFGKTDGIRITPSFTFVSKDGKMQTPVDFYYNDDHRTFIKVGSPEDTEERYIILNDRLRNVPEEELTDTARYKYDHYYTFAEMNGVSRDMFISDYIRRFTKEKTPIGGFDLLLLPEQARTLIGPKANLPGSVDFARANAAVQKWYGHYTLPGDPYVVAEGTNLAEYGRTHGGLTKRDPIFLRDGYIILNFNIESIHGGNLDAPHLQYINAPLMNQWTLEGFKRSVQDFLKNTFTLRDGDIVFYNADKSYKDDFQAEVNH